MKKIGFIDYFLDEWHANNYPQFIKEQSEGRYEVAYAYGKIDSPEGGMTSKEWSEHYNIELCDTIEELVEKSDCLVVLAPDNPETHEELTDLALKSGKLVFIDKTFSDTKAAAQNMFDNADAHGTKCYTTSALRYAEEFKTIDKSKISKIYTSCPGTYSDYSVHQLDPIVMLMDAKPVRIMALGDKKHPAHIIEFADGRFVQTCHCNNTDFTYRIVDGNNNADIYTITSDFFAVAIKEMVNFFDTGVVPVPHEQTMNAMAIRDAGIKAMEKPFTWVEI